MLKKHPLLIIILLVTVNLYSQDTARSITPGKELKGIVIDKDKNEALSYANVFVANKNIGTLSNENGMFTISLENFEEGDTLKVQYIGYKTQSIIKPDASALLKVYMEEDTYNLNDVLVFAEDPDPKDIVKQILERKDENYKNTFSKNNTFIRSRNISNIASINLDVKKNNIEELDADIFEHIEEYIPKHSLSYTDFLGDVYINQNKADSVKSKMDPIRVVRLKEKDITELDEVEKIFENLLTNNEEGEYWKVKSGIFSEKINVEDKEKEDKPEENKDADEADKLKKNERLVKNFNNWVYSKLKYSKLEKKDDWEFLYKPGRYDYELVGGTRIKGEDVYIIDFVPKGKGSFTGRMFVSIETYALIRADYEYAPGETGRDIKIFGISYKEDSYRGSIYFENEEGNYLLKYYSLQTGFSAGVNRNISLIKKRDRFLFDKKLKKLKIGLDIAINEESSIELFVLNRKKINQKQFKQFSQKEKFELIFVDSFDENLWKGYDIIEPTSQMRSYKKRSSVEEE
ncbi:MAG: carboxypeptidase-like regulatory domain-containing protein [Bacteroidota bacterium]